MKPRGRLLRSSTDVWVFGRCQADVSSEETREWRRRQEKTNDMQCRNNAKYEIDGKRYCGKHAGNVALSIVLGEQ